LLVGRAAALAGKAGPQRTAKPGAGAEAAAADLAVVAAPAAAMADPPTINKPMHARDPEHPLIFGHIEFFAPP
jgi:hypothetical protein